MSRSLTVLLVSIGALAVIVGGVFVARALDGADPIASWYSAAVGILGGGALAVYAVIAAPRR